MTHGDKVLEFFNITADETANGYWECNVCYISVESAIIRDGQAIFTCKNGHENIQ